jgi:hypothetical protein
MPSKLTKRLVESLVPKEKAYEHRDAEVTGFICRVEPTRLKTFWLAYSFGGKRGNRYKLGTLGNVSVEGARNAPASGRGHPSALAQTWKAAAHD